MEETDYDILVLGGSANGANAAYSASVDGKRVAIIEEHPKTGYPEHCSGLFSYWGLLKLDALPPKEIIFNEDIYGSRIIAPNGKILTVRKSEKHALVCDRAAFDQFLVEKAINAGAQLFQPFKAINAQRKNGKILLNVRSNEGEIIELTAKILISAEGIRANIATQLGLNGPPEDNFVNASQYYMHNLNDIDKTLVEVYQSKKFASNFIGWIIPMSEDSAKIGLGTSKKAASKQLDLMIKEHPVLKEKCKGAEIRRATAGRIPTTGTVKKTYADNLLLTGDVAGQTKPTTGGGVILGGIAAQIAGKVASEAIDTNRTDERFLSVYQKRWKKEMYWNLKLMKLVRNYLNKLSDIDINDFFVKLDQKGILRDIEEYGHVDDQGILVKKFMKTLSLYPFYLKTSPKLILSILNI